MMEIISNQLSNGYFDEYIKNFFNIRALSESKTIYDFFIGDKQLLNKKAKNQLISQMKKVDGNLLLQSLNPDIYDDLVFVWLDKGFLKIEGAHLIDKEITVHGIFLDKSFCKQIKLLIEQFLKPLEQEEDLNVSVYILGKSISGLEISELGEGGLPLIRGNYTKDVLSEADNIIDNITKSNPDGRLAIIKGPPGGGKTHLIRGIMNEAPDAKFLTIPPHMMNSIADPAIITALMDRQIKGEDPLVIILEDADECLVKRSGNNMSAISSLLNISDGIIGSVLDIKVIATTNVKNLDIDDAIQRPGRLISNFEISDLPFNHACKIVKRILQDNGFKPAIKKDVLEKKFSAPIYLANIYKVAKDFIKQYQKS